MNPEIQKLVTVLTESLQEGKEFVLDQAPDVVQEIVLYHRMMATMNCLVFVILATSCILAFCKVIAIAKKYIRDGGNASDDISGCHAFFAVLSGVPAVAFVAILIGRSLPYLLKACFCPKLLILDHLAGLL